MTGSSTVGGPADGASTRAGNAANGPQRRAGTAAPLSGLVLAGGRGRRIGADKGALDFHGLAQVRWAAALLAERCDRAYVSLRRDQAGQTRHRGLELIIDQAAFRGPAAGLLGAWEAHPDTAWLVLAVDMPLVDRRTLGALLEARDTEALATAFRQADGTPEPLCAIWEPAARAVLADAAASAASGRGVSLRRVLEAPAARLIEAPEPARLASVNSPADEQAVRSRLRGGGNG